MFPTIFDLILCGMPETVLKQIFSLLRGCFTRIVALMAATAMFASLLRLPALADDSSVITPAVEASPTPIPLRSVDIPNDGKWHYSVTPYLFVPQINGTFQFRVPGIGGHKPVTIGPHEPPSSYLPHVNALTMISGEARRGKAVAAFDYIWLNISSQKSGVTNVTGPANAGFRITANILTLEAGRTIAHSDAATVETLVGVRSLNLNTALNWNLSAPNPILPQSGTVAKSGTVSDIVAAVRGKVRLGNRLFLPYYFDCGYGNQSSTVQAITGLAYEEPWGSVSLQYRALIYNADPVSLNQRLTFNGLSVGVTWTH